MPGTHIIPNIEAGLTGPFSRVASFWGPRPSEIVWDKARLSAERLTAKLEDAYGWQGVLAKQSPPKQSFLKH